MGRRKSEALACHLLLGLLDQTLDHIAADVARFAGGQVAVIALLEVDAQLARDLLLHVAQRVFGLRHVDLIAVAVVRHVFFTSNRFTTSVAVPAPHILTVFVTLSTR